MRNIILSIDHTVTYIEGKLGKDVYKGLKKHLGYLPEDAFWMIKHNSEKSKKEGKKWKQGWDGYISTVCWNKQFCKCNIKKEGTHFKSGLIGKALKFFDENNVSYKIIDIRKKTPRTNSLSLSNELEYRDYQQEIIKKALNTDRGIIKAPTGSGKTAVACGVIAGSGVFPTIFYVPSKDLLLQAKDEIEKFVHRNGKPVEVGQIGAGKKDIKDINVMTIQTAVRALGGVWIKYDEEDYNEDDTDLKDSRKEIAELIRESRLIFIDECQHVSSETCQIISDNSILCQYRYGMSATPWRSKGDDILIDGCFGKCIAEVSASDLIRRGYLVKPRIYFFPMSNMRGTKWSSYAKVYKHCLVENSKRNEWIAKSAIKLASEGRNILVLCRQIAHGKILEKLIPDSVFMHGSHSAKKRKEHLDKMRSGEERITLATSIFDQGIDCKPLDALILAGSGSSSTRALQRIGRILRPYKGKEDAIVIDFIDRCKYLESHSRKREKIYRTEPEFDIVKCAGLD